MEIDDEKQSFHKTESLKEVKSFIKMEKKSLNLSSDDIQIVAYDRMAHTYWAKSNRSNLMSREV